VSDERIKVLFELNRDEDGYPPVEVEQLWAEPLGTHRYRIDNVPFFVKGISCQDIVEAVADSAGELRYRSLITASARSTLRVIVFRNSPDTRPIVDRVADLRRHLEQTGCSTELSYLPGLVAVDVDRSSLEGVIQFLIRGEQADLWEYEEAAVRP
jgi:hypothetical protein